MEISAIDMFCGAGGLTYGLQQAGISVIRGLDTNRPAEYPYQENTGSTYRKVDIKPLARNPERIKQMYPWNPDLSVLGACAPCQPYSTLSHTKKGDTTDHNKWGLLDDVRKIVKYVKPDVVVTENVLQVRHDDTYQQFEEALKEMGYSLNPRENRKVYGPEYGIPQKRKRWVLLASQEGQIRLPDPLYTDESEYPTVRETIGHLPAIQAGEVHPENDLHRARKLTDKNLERIDNMEPGGDWTLWEERGLDHLLADCHKKASGRSYKAPYSRMRPDEPAPTITTQFYNYGSGRFGHYDTDQNRALSLLEGALLQTFPEDYDFYDEWEEVGAKNVGRLIGNAVPPLLAEHIGNAIVDHVSGDETTVAAMADDD